ncbi:MAG: AAA family ATPase [Actinobacteria bacterium]|nr:AAA family ATPase [Actinomycetota bacterium]
MPVTYWVMDDAEREARRRRREEWALDALARQTAVVDDLEARAADPLRWLALRRQALSYLRHLDTWQQGRAFSEMSDVLDAHQRSLQDRVAAAESELAGMDHVERRHLEGRLGLRLAVIGKGGAGKTVICSTLARLLARQGRKVLAVDMDTNPGLAYSIGLEAAGGDHGLSPDALEESPGAAYGWQLRSGLLPREAVERFAVPAPDGVAFLSMGKIGEVDKSSAKRTVVAVIQILLGFGEPGWDVIGDLEAGPTTPFERYHAFSDDVMVVVGPAWRSALTARRLLPMVGDGRRTTIVANRFRNERDHPGLVPRIRIPFDPQVAEAERQGLSPLDVCPDSPAIRAIAQVAELFVSQEVPV